MSGASFWRVAGLSYLRYAAIGAAATRNALKEGLRAEAAKRGAVHFRHGQYNNGKLVGEKTIHSGFRK
eukprot:CAMPEP_0195523066 /NCGR_PEP_ID=MMETSP0794_2-20130614/21865_1 /TAXON_ID=515487 /ORGANISM="Stephanopyxis turris, Strain CCMP 815" /LENGTH=67 /DNA_ID=CAMNT_0040652979 /DNA_START=71 /DNA_END=274 /DNA_ORIENTATION=-